VFQARVFEPGGRGRIGTVELADAHHGQSWVRPGEVFVEGGAAVDESGMRWER
jgi:hypothetical protein